MSGECRIRPNRRPAQPTCGQHMNQRKVVAAPGRECSSLGVRRRNHAASAHMQRELCTDASNSVAYRRYRAERRGIIATGAQNARTMPVTARHLTGKAEESRKPRARSLRRRTGRVSSAWPWGLVGRLRSTGALKEQRAHSLL